VIALVWFERNIAYHILRRSQELDPNATPDEQPAAGADSAAADADEVRAPPA
jgi:hypothetical protein